MRAGVWVGLVLCAIGVGAMALFCVAVAWATSRVTDAEDTAPHRPVWLPPDDKGAA